MASADREPVKSTPKSLAAGADPCKDLNVNNGKCTVVATLKSKSGDSTTTLYNFNSEAGEAVTFVFVTAKGSERTVSPDISFLHTLEAGTWHSLVKATPKLRQIMIDGAPAVALQVVSTSRATSPDKSTKARTWDTFSFVVCGAGKNGAACTRISFGDDTTSCSAALSDSGEIKHSCTETTQLSL
ncbi:MAG: hypothetical protein JWO36_406 [Myxococcales bacterium]|nr:hypothetical protein [Myxococcales bacterium]